jgi:hypothetical protein
VELKATWLDVSFASALLKAKSEVPVRRWAESDALRLFRCWSTEGALGKKSANLLVDRDMFRHNTSRLPDILAEMAAPSMIA